MTTHPKREYEKLVDDVISYASMQGYATSGAERSVHRESLRKAKAALLDHLASQLAAQKSDNAQLQYALEQSEAKWIAAQKREGEQESCTYTPEEVAAIFRRTYGCDMPELKIKPDQDREVSP